MFTRVKPYFEKMANMSERDVTKGIFASLLSSSSLSLPPSQSLPHTSLSDLNSLLLGKGLLISSFQKWRTGLVESGVGLGYTALGLGVVVHTHTHSYTHILTHALSHIVIHTLTYTRILTHSHIHTPHALSHSHTHTHILVYTHTHTHSHSFD